MLVIHIIVQCSSRRQEWCFLRDQQCFNHIKKSGATLFSSLLLNSDYWDEPHTNKLTFASVCSVLMSSPRGFGGNTRV